MSSCNRRLFLALPLALAACGFQPAYGPQGVASGLRGTIRAADPTDRNGNEFVGRIEARLGQPEVARYDLSYTIRTEAVGVGITTDNSITRFNLTGSVDWALTDRQSGARVTGGTVENFTSWTATGTTVAGVAAEEDAARRLMIILADQIVLQLLAAAPRLPQ